MVLFFASSTFSLRYIWRISVDLVYAKPLDNHDLYSSKRHIRPLITILSGGLELGFRVGGLGVVRVWVRVSKRVRVEGSVSKGGQGQFWVRVRIIVRVELGLGLLLGSGLG